MIVTDNLKESLSHGGTAAISLLSDLVIRSPGHRPVTVTGGDHASDPPAIMPVTRRLVSLGQVNVQGPQ